MESYQELEESGKSLSTEQKKAVEKYDEVVQGLELSRDFSKQFQAIYNSASKDAKREAKKVSFPLSLCDFPNSDINIVFSQI